MREKGDAAERARRARKSLRVAGRPDLQAPAALRVRVLLAIEARPLSLRGVEARVREALRREGLPVAERAEIEAAVRAVADLRAPGLFYVKSLNDLRRVLTEADLRSLPRACLRRREDLEEGQIASDDEEEGAGVPGAGGGGVAARASPLGADGAAPEDFAEGGGLTESGDGGSARRSSKRARREGLRSAAAAVGDRGKRHSPKADTSPVAGAAAPAPAPQGGLEGPLGKLAGAYAARGGGGVGPRGSPPHGGASCPAERSIGGERNFSASTAPREEGRAAAAAAGGAAAGEDMFLFLSQEEKTSTEVSKSAPGKRRSGRRRGGASVGTEEAEPGAKEAWVTSRAADDSWLERHCNRAPEPPRPIRSDREFEQQLSEYEGKYAAYFHAHQQLERGERDQRALWQARCASADPAHRAALESQLLALHRAGRARAGALDRAYRLLHWELAALRAGLERWVARAAAPGPRQDPKPAGRPLAAA